MIKRYQNLIVCTLLFLLISCRTQSEYANELEGSWLGTIGTQHWCFSLLQEKTSKAGQGSIAYRNFNSASSRAEYGAGVWYVGVGGRFQINLHPVELDDNLNPLPVTQYKTEATRYLIRALEKNQIKYHEHKTDGTFGTEFISKRVENCERFYEDAKSNLASSIIPRLKNT